MAAVVVVTAAAVVGAERPVTPPASTSFCKSESWTGDSEGGTAGDAAATGCGAFTATPRVGVADCDDPGAGADAAAADAALADTGAAGLAVAVLRAGVVVARPPAGVDGARMGVALADAGPVGVAFTVRNSSMAALT